MTTVNPFKNTRIEFHILQSFPVTCLNRDDVGAPKTAVVGGVTRARVSSQCWKRQVRLAMHEFGIKLGIRTKHVTELEEQACIEIGASEEQAKACASALADALSKDTLHFFTRTEALELAKLAQEKEFDSSKLSPKEVQKRAKKAFNPNIDGLDIALFGRMVAQAKDVNLNVEAAASFAHAISTHAVNNEVEFFTALDDQEQGHASGHMGSLEFNSATYYRYVALDLGQLWESLRGESLSKAIEAFTKALFVAVPSARQTTQAGACGWDYARVLVRKGQGIQISFDKPVRAKNGYLEPSVEALESGLAVKEKMAGSLFGKVAEYTLSKDSNLNIDGLVQALTQYVEVPNA